MQEKAREEQAIGGKALRERQSLAALRGRDRRTNPQREQVLTDSHKQPFMRVLCHPKSYTHHSPREESRFPGHALQ